MNSRGKAFTALPLGFQPLLRSSSSYGLVGTNLCWGDRRKMAMNRREFVKYALEAGTMATLVGGFSVLSTSRTYVRPPGAVGVLLRRCIKCGACIEVCPTRALQQADLTFDLKSLWTPVLNPRYGGCLAWSKECLKCVDVCPTAALERPRDLRQVKLGIVRIDREKCVNCMLCFQKCPIGGALLFPNPDGKPFVREERIPTTLKLVNSPLKPYVNDTKCVGCGLCVFYCPVHVMALEPLPSKGMK